MRVVVLVPYRAGGDRRRIRTWDLCRKHLEKWPIYEGQPDTEVWNRAAACNAAARQGRWDVAIVADADTIHGYGILERAVDHVIRTGRAVVPWDHRYKLSRAASDEAIRTGRIVSDEQDGREGEKRWNRPGYPTWKCGGTTVLSRQAWEAVSGFDETFTVWGHEDCAQRLALDTLVGLDRLPGTIWHLWHPHAKPSSRENLRRFNAYRKAHGKPEAMRAVIG